MSIRDKLPTLRPSLTLNFSNTKQLDPRVSFSRSSVGSFYDHTGKLVVVGADQPRFTHNPKTLESLGLLVEESRQNLLSNSQDFSSASYTKLTVTITANTHKAPDGSLTADTVSSASGDNRLYQTSSVTAGTAYTFSVFVKNIDSTSVRLDFRNQTQGPTFFFGSKTFTADAGWTTKVEELPDDWFRLSATYTSVSTGSGGWQVYIPNNSSIVLWLSLIHI